MGALAREVCIACHSHIVQLMKVAPVPSTNSTKDELATECRQSIGGEVGDAIGVITTSIMSSLAVSVRSAEGEIEIFRIAGGPNVTSRCSRSWRLRCRRRGLLVRNIGNFKDKTAFGGRCSRNFSASAAIGFVSVHVALRGGPSPADIPTC